MIDGEWAWLNNDRSKLALAYEDDGVAKAHAIIERKGDQWHWSVAGKLGGMTGTADSVQAAADMVENAIEAGGVLDN